MGCIMSSDSESDSGNKYKKLSNLEDCTIKNVRRFNLKNKIFKAKVVKVYDGDTITVVFKFYDDFYKFSVRMDGYDSPEIKTSDPEEKKWAVESKTILSDLILDKIVTLNCKEFDKYGRILGNVFFKDKNVNDYMLAHGYCRPYGGGTKCQWDFTAFKSMKSRNNNI